MTTMARKKKKTRYIISCRYNKLSIDIGGCYGWSEFYASICAYNGAQRINICLKQQPIDRLIDISIIKELE